MRETSRRNFFVFASELSERLNLKLSPKPDRIHCKRREQLRIAAERVRCETSERQDVDLGMPLKTWYVRADAGCSSAGCSKGLSCVPRFRRQGWTSWCFPATTTQDSAPPDVSCEHSKVDSYTETGLGWSRQLPLAPKSSSDREP